jgi:hypothetical protein
MTASLLSQIREPFEPALEGEEFVPEESYIPSLQQVDFVSEMPT